MKAKQKIKWKIHLRSSPEKVFQYLTTDEGRKKFWAEESIEENGEISFSFINGQKYTSRILSIKFNELFEIEYLDSIAKFLLEKTEDKGTDLTLINSEVKPKDFLDNYAGWASVLLALKATVDFDVDLRNHDKTRTWNELYLDN